MLDSSIGGLGGCPFAPRATGNISTEDLNYLLVREGIGPALNHEKMAEIVNKLDGMLPGKISGQLARAGWPLN